MHQGRSAKVAEYTNSRSAEGLDPPNECLGYAIKQSDGKAQVMLRMKKKNIEEIKT